MFSPLQDFLENIFICDVLVVPMLVGSCSSSTAERVGLVNDGRGGGEGSTDFLPSHFFRRGHERKKNEKRETRQDFLSERFFPSEIVPAPLLLSDILDGCPCIYRQG